MGKPMLQVHDLSDLIESDRQDVLSVSLDVDPTQPEHQALVPAYRIWLRNTLRGLLEGLTKDVRRVAGKVAERVLEYVEANRPRGRGLVLLAAPDLWREYLLPFPVPNRVHYGRPDVVPLLWALDEYEPYAILAVYRDHARLLLAYLGRTTVVEEEALELDTSDWRFKAGRQPTFTQKMGIGASRGAQRDTFESRVEAQVYRFWQGAAEATAELLGARGVERLIIGGSEGAANAVRDLLPQPARGRVVSMVPLPAYADLAEIQRRTLPAALAEERRREAELVAAVLERAASQTGAVVGVVDTLYALMQGQVMTLVVDRDVEDNVWRCARCGYVSGVSIQTCPTCGGAVEQTSLPQVLPLLARRSGAKIELVGGVPAENLRPHEGIGAFLRYVSS
ncbi:MAG: hypothetical protein HYZ68_03455 [Chloroflexi bacterium]|nr:hypothetical protein [Chloroflexota bacterium]